ncbi:hypothetical protein Efla_006411 [Eimeria flavescens]
MNATDRTAAVPSGGPPRDALLPPFNRPLAYPSQSMSLPQQQRQQLQQQQAFAYQLKPPTGFGGPSSPPAPFLWQQQTQVGPPLRGLGSSVRASSRLPACRPPQQQQTQPLHIQVLPSAAGGAQNLQGHLSQPHSTAKGPLQERVAAARVLLPGSASRRSQSKGPLEARSFSMSSSASLSIPLPAASRYLPNFPHGGPHNAPGLSGSCQLVFKPQNGSQRVQQFLFQQQQQPQQQQQQVVSVHATAQQQLFPGALELPRTHQQSSPFLQAVKRTQSSYPKLASSCSSSARQGGARQQLQQQTHASRGVIHAIEPCFGKEEQGGFQGAGGVAVEELTRASSPRPQTGRQPAEDTAMQAAAALGPLSLDGLETEAGEAAASNERPVEGRRRAADVHLWKPLDSSCSEALAAQRPSPYKPRTRASTGGARLKPLETDSSKDCLLQQQQQQQLQQGVSKGETHKAAPLRLATAPPVSVSRAQSEDMTAPCGLPEEESWSMPTLRDVSDDSTVASRVRGDGGEVSLSADSLLRCLDDPKEELASKYAAREDNDVSTWGREDPAGGEESVGALTAGEEGSVADCSEKEDEEEEEEEDFSVEEERYVKVLVPGYIDWLREKQQQAEEAAAEEDSAYGEADNTLWASDLVIDTSPEGLGRAVVVNTKQCKAERPLINTCVARLGWIRDDETTNKGNIIWLGGSVPDHDYVNFMRNSQVVNRFPGMWDMTKKRMLSKVLYFYQDLFPDLYDFSPPCWAFPEDRARIEKLLHPRNVDTYIIKPDGGAMGSGIQLVSRYRDIDGVILRGEGNYVMQKYIDRPRLLNRRKFDLRVYAAVFSVTGQLKVFLSRVGMARFCTDEYRPPTRRNQDNAFMHLTNYSINKENANYFIRSSDIHSTSNSKRLLKDVLEDLRDEGVNVEKVWQSIKDITVKTFVCLQPWLELRYRHVYRGARQHEPSRCFQFLGLDILLDEDDKCWLLEVNSNPSLRVDYFDSQYEGIDVQLESTMDRAIKEPAVSEALALASKLLLPPEKKKTKDGGSAAACGTAAGKRGVSKSQHTGGGRPCAGAAKQGRTKGRGSTSKNKKGESQQQQTPPQSETLQTVIFGSSASTERSSSTASEEATRPQTPPLELFSQAAAQQMKKQTAAADSSCVGGLRSREARGPAASLRRCASVSGGRPNAEEKRQLRRAVSSANLGVPTAAAAPAAAAAGEATAARAAHARVSAATDGPQQQTAETQRLPDELHVDVSDSEIGEGRAPLPADSELVSAAYKEIKKCMECFNVLGLRFQRSATGSLKQNNSNTRWPNAACGVHTPEETDAAASRRGASRVRVHAPFRPFLRKDRNLAKKNAASVKCTYTKLHKQQQRISANPLSLCLPSLLRRTY